MDVRKAVLGYHERAASNPRHRYRSWEHCFGYFRTLHEESGPDSRRVGALHLAFFLASWGMYRGSSFLLQLDYTVHEAIVDRLLSPGLKRLRSAEVGAPTGDSKVTHEILSAVASVRQGYSSFGKATDTLITKVLLGTTACLPACDRYFIAGYRNAGFAFSGINARFVDTAVEICARPPFLAVQNELRDATGLHYPLMKIVDMYFWEMGYELSGAPRSAAGSSPSRGTPRSNPGDHRGAV